MTASNLSDRRIEYGDRLKTHRVAVTPRLTGKALAERLGWRAAKVSLIEGGKQLPTEPELGAWAEVVGITADDLAALLQELRAIRLDDARWKARLRTGGHESAQRSFAEMEAAAATIVNFEPALVPGPLQTPGYARAMFASMAALKDAGDDLDAAVAARMQRQNVLYDETKTIEILFFEASLRNSIASDAVMAAQADRLLAATQNPNLRLGIIPVGVQVPYVLLHGFWLFDDELLIAEMLHTEVTTRDPEDVRLYRRYLADMWEVAAEGEAARTLLQRVLGDLA
ncbi:helix-turn-helix domain-containing protein [Amycolatopsis benzoatilytica]|uniref:helix-turn-helix domain-containing protein n=1 Tax=Amycolatopsis benzoatilytica TaxID=346045 RepID=UPI000376D60A|nr:helix-turn-helix transcriptional regulator [Amycolatopsis benzoatilytica]